MIHSKKIKILQVSNIISHHQIPIAKELANIVGEENFKFCATQKPEAERIKLGWSDKYNYPWILRAGERKNDQIVFNEWWNDADIVICGERYFEKMEDRLEKNKICFYMSERWWKPPIGAARLLSPNFIKIAAKFRKIAKSNLFHYLAIGPYAENDIKLIHPTNNNIWRWGYFTSQSNPRTIIKNEPVILKVLWVGRMLSWKRVDTLIKALHHLENNNSINFKLTLVGDGPEKEKLKIMASSLLKKIQYEFIDPIPADEITNLMASQNVYVLPSNKYEGWGAVVNEAMSCGLAVISSRGAGSAAAIIQDGKNGLLFDPGNWHDLALALNKLIDNNHFLLYLATNGQNTIYDNWSPKEAAERLHCISTAILDKREIKNFELGPMSKSQKQLYTCTKY